MKKKTALSFLFVFCLAFQLPVWAGTTVGTVTSVDFENKKIEVVTEEQEDSSWVSYGDATQWPSGVTDPSGLLDHKVEIMTDESGLAAVIINAP